ncbi:hypothetical protein IFR05_002514 [Cadophora sp. M221]|nr:hypothetical protein IFR05_002514 [Cadophora sp. M221]
MVLARDPNMKSIDELRRWLQPTEYLSPGNEYIKHLKSYTPGTGDWLRESEVFRAWEDDTEKGCLWVRGIAGSGKSVFAAATVKTLAETQDGGGLKRPVLFFFFRQIVEKNHDPKYLIRDWIAQLLPFSSDLQEKVNGLSTGSIDTIESGKLWDVLVGCMQQQKKVYCVADALDEMDDQHASFINQLKELGALKPESIKVMLTSRPTASIENQLRHLGIESVRLEPSEIFPDILTYVSTRIASLKPRLSRDKETQVREAVCALSEGLFLYARLLMDSIADGLEEGSITLAQLPTAIAQLPRNLTELYTRLLSEHARRSRMTMEQQLVILQCVTQSSRPMRLIELGSIVAFLMKDTGVGLTEGKEAVKQACGRFLDLLDDETISVIHHSFTEFARDKNRSANADIFPILSEKAAHEKLLELCLQYLNSCEQTSLPFDSPAAGKDSEETPDSDIDSEYYDGPHRKTEARKEGVRVKMMQDLHSLYPFMAYAAENLGYHMEHPGATTKFSLLDQYFVPSKTAFQMWIMNHLPGDKKINSQPLHFAASLGLTQYAEYILVNGSKVDAQDAGERTPLMLAAEKGHTAVASLLLSHGANPDHEDMSGYKPMHLAVLNNQTDIVMLLLKAGVSCKTEKTKCPSSLMEPQVESDIGETPLQYACQRGNMEILDLFIPFMNEDDASKCLRWAVKSRRPDAAEAIIKTGKAPVDALVDGTSSLIVAASKMDDSLIEVLLRNGADPNLRAEKEDCRVTLYAQGEMTLKTESPNGTTAIHALAGIKGDEVAWADRIKIGRCLKLLVEAGSDVNSRTVGNHAPLHYAVQKRYSMFGGWGSEKAEYIVTDLLLQHGADPNLRCGSGATPLHKVDPELPEIIDLLVRHGAHVNAKDSKGSSPILKIAAASSGRWSASFGGDEQASKEASVIKLIDHGADVTIEDENGWTVLHHMFSGIKYFGSEKLWKAIIKAGVDLNKPNRNGKPPLLSMSGAQGGPGNENLLKFLVGEGLKLTSTDASEQNILFGLFDMYDVEWEPFQKLLDLGCSAKARDTNGGTLLHRCIQICHSFDFIEKLVYAGADPRAVDNDGNTLFHELALGHPGSTAFASGVLMLQEMGVEIDSRNKAGQTTLHIAFATENIEDYGRYRGKLFVDWLLNKKVCPSLNIDAVDNIGASPIHYAASFCETHVGRLIKAGADATLKTNEGLTPLHIAARGRQSGIVAVLLWEFRNRGVLDRILDAKDHIGRTALHYACRSGRPESVRFLIEAGASFSVRDNVGLSPVHSIAELEEENLIWTTKHPGDLPQGFHAACVTIGDLARPGSLNRYFSASEAVRSQDIIVILETAGADFKVTVQIGGEELTVMDLAVAGNCVELVNELRKRGLSAKNVAAEALIPKPGGMKEAKEILGIAEPSRRGGRQPVNDAHVTKIEHAKKFADILQRRDYNIFEEFVKVGGDLTVPGQWGHTSGLHELVKWGNASFIEKYCVEVASLEEMEWKEEEESKFDSLLSYASQQSLPRLEIIRALVEVVKVDINHISNRHGFTNGGLMVTPLHWLSAGAHFWNIEAISYLLDHGADIEARNIRGETPLMSAVGSDPPNGYWKEETIRILLERGANPNVLDIDGYSCLNMADHVNIIRLLLNHGADIKVGAPVTDILTIANMDFDSAELLLKAGRNPNDEYALHVAARPFDENCDYLAALMVQQQRAMISLLLKYDARPFILLSDGSSMLQKIIEDHGILDLFWDIPDFPLELRGSGGRTPLISACFPPITPAPRDWSFEEHPPKPVCYPTAAFKLLAMGANAGAEDDVGRTALHWMCTFSEELDEAHQVLFADLVVRSPEIVHRCDKEGFTPLHIAFSGSHTHIWITDVLISHGCDPTKADPRGNTVLHYLASQLLGETKQALAAAERFQYFLSLGVSIKHRNNLGETAIFPFIAKSWKRSANDGFKNDITHLKALPIFVDAGADLQVCNDQGRNLLHVTAERLRKKERWSVGKEQQDDMVEIFKELMDRGIDPRAEDKQCRTAIDVAVTCGKTYLVDLFGPKERGMRRLVVEDTADEDSEESGESEE